MSRGRAPTPGDCNKHHCTNKQDQPDAGSAAPKKGRQLDSHTASRQQNLESLTLPFLCPPHYYRPTIGMPCPFETTFVNKERRFPFFDCDRLLVLDPELSQAVNLDAISEHELNKELVEIHRVCSCLVFG